MIYQPTIKHNTITRRFILALLILAIIVSYAICVEATSMHSTTSTSYTAVLSGYDNNNSYSVTQGSVTWNGYSKNYWPSGYYIYYAPYLNDYTKAGYTSMMGTIGGTSGASYYSGYGYHSQYRVGSYTSASAVDTEFSFFV